MFALQRCCSWPSPVRQTFPFIFTDVVKEAALFILFTDQEISTLHHLYSCFCFFVTGVNTCLSIALNVDGVVIHPYEEEVMCVWIEQQCE